MTFFLPETPYEPSPADASLPTQLSLDPDATFSAFTNAFLRLRVAGFGQVFLPRLAY